MEFKGKNINLGCGKRIYQENGWLNHDIWYHHPLIDVAFDLNNFPYPFDDNTFKKIRMVDVLEHLDELLKVLAELHRILDKDGELYMRVVGENSTTRWIDPTHRRPYTTKSLDFLDPTRDRGETFGFYTRNKWNILTSKEDESKSIIFVMQPIKI